METIETQTAVKIFAARNMPQGSHTQRNERQTAIQFARRAAADVPLEVMRLCARGLKQAETVAGHGTRAASADVELGAALLHAAAVENYAIYYRQEDDDVLIARILHGRRDQIAAWSESS